MRRGLVASERHDLTLFEGGGARSPWISIYLWVQWILIIIIKALAATDGDNVASIVKPT
jgi:hypothetical protein